MYSRPVFFYLAILLFDSMYSAHLHTKIERKNGKRLGENEEDKNAVQEKIYKDNLSNSNEDTSGEKHNKEEEKINIGNSAQYKQDDNLHIDDIDHDKDDKNSGDLSSEIDKVDMPDNNNHEANEGSTGNKQTTHEEVGAVDNNHDENEAQVRLYKVGDTFTPQELLPVAIKLRSKVNKPGSGKGFVSSSKSPEQLADKLFEAFFMSFKRIVTLGELDIAGLDALQALALSGEAIQNTSETITEPAQTKYLRGQFIKIRRPKTSKFKLIMKRIDPKEENLENAKRRGIELAKKLRKKRRLVVNKHRRAKGDKHMILRKKRRLVVNKRRNGQDINSSSTKQKESACHWGYECSNPNDLDTCQLVTKCVDHNKASKEDFIAVPHKSDEHSKAIQQFRKMLGITVVDEEVEKILENRIIRLKPNSLNAGERVESLSEYFNSIMMQQELGTTTALSPSANDGDPTEINNDNETEEDNKKIVETDFKNENKENQQDTHQIRKSLRFPIKSTPSHGIF